MATVAVLAGLVIGTAVPASSATPASTSVGSPAWFGVTTPFFFGIPKFSVAAIISMIVVMLITAVETTGDVFATGEIVEKRVGAEDVAEALRADGLATFIGGVLNSFPYTCFAENVGLVRLTRVKSRYVVAAAGVFMILIGLIPKAGALVASIPPPGARRRGDRDVRDGGRGRYPDPVPGRLPRPPQRRHRRHQPRPGRCSSPCNPMWPRRFRSGRRSSSAAASPWAACARSC